MTTFPSFTSRSGSLGGDGGGDLLAIALLETVRVRVSYSKGGYGGYVDIIVTFSFVTRDIFRFIQVL